MLKYQELSYHWSSNIQPINQLELYNNWQMLLKVIGRPTVLDLEKLNTMFRTRCDFSHIALDIIYSLHFRPPQILVNTFSNGIGHMCHTQPHSRLPFPNAYMSEVLHTHRIPYNYGHPSQGHWVYQDDSGHIMHPCSTLQVEHSTVPSKQTYQVRDMLYNASTNIYTHAVIIIIVYGFFSYLFRAINLDQVILHPGFIHNQWLPDPPHNRILSIILGCLTHRRVRCLITVVHYRHMLYRLVLKDIVQRLINKHYHPPRNLRLTLRPAHHKKSLLMYINSYGHRKNNYLF